MSTSPLVPRTLVATSLVATALLSATSVLLQPEFPADRADQLTAIADAGTTATVSAIAFTLAQLPFLVAFVGVAALTRDRRPVLSAVGGVLAVLGGFGHAVFGGVAMVQLEMAADRDNVAVHADVLGAVESSPAVIFMALGLVGTVLGLLLLSIALWRAGVGPRWVPPLVWVFLVVEFVGTNVSDSATYVSGICYLLALGGLAAHLVTTAQDASRPAPAVRPEEAAR